MLKTVSQSRPDATPVVYTVNPVYIWCLSALLTGDTFALVYALVVHNDKPLTVLLLFALVGGAILFMIRKIRLTTDDEGIEQTGLAGEGRIRWDTIIRVERSRGYIEFFGEADKELLHLSLVSKHAQTVVFEKAIARAGLTRSGAKRAYPIFEVWTR